MEKLLKEIEKCEFECEAGNLKGCRSWQELKKRIIPTKEIEKLIKSEGIANTKYIIQEELGELSHEISKDLRGKLDKEHLLEEMADVYIVLNMAQKVYEISNRELYDEVNRKMARNLKRAERS